MVSVISWISNKIMVSRKGNILTLALVTTCIEMGLYLVPFFGLISYMHVFVQVAESLDFLGELMRSNFPIHDLILGIAIGIIGLLFLILLFLGIELYGIIERNKCFITFGLIFRGIRFIIVDIVCLTMIIMWVSKYKITTLFLTA